MTLKLLWKALLGPIVVMGLAATILGRTNEYTPSNFVRELDKMVVESQPNIVILGSSFAETNMSPAVLSEKLDVPLTKIVTLSQPTSWPPVWYAMERFRLYDNNARPKVIVLVTELPALTVTSVPAARLPYLLQHFASPDPVLAHKSLGQSDFPAWNRMLGRRAEPRDYLLALSRSVFTGLWFTPPAGKTDTDLQIAAAADVFGAIEGNGNAITTRALPVMELEETGRQDTVTIQDPRESLLVDMADLAAANGAHLVVVVSPSAATYRNATGLDPKVEADFVRLANEKHIGWVDLRRLDLGDGAFNADGRHMKPAGARAFSAVIAEKLTEIGALAGGEMRSASPPATVSRVERLGEGPALVPSRTVSADGCKWGLDLGAWSFLERATMQDAVGIPGPTILATLDGQALPLFKADSPPCTPAFAFRGARTPLQLPAGRSLSEVHLGLDPSPDSGAGWWVYPGTELRWTVEDLPTQGTMDVKVFGREMGPSSAMPELRVQGQVQPLSKTSRGLEASFQVTSSGSAEIGVRSPENGPFLVIRTLSVEAADQHTDLVRRPSLRPMELLAQATALSPPPAVDVAPPENKGGYYAFAVPWGNSTTCPPLRVLEDGVELPTSDNVTPQPQGNMVQHLGEWLYFRPGGGDPDQHHYQVMLSESRRCTWHQQPYMPGIRWIYPGDHLYASLSAEDRKPAFGSLKLLRVTGEVMTGGAEDATLRVTVRWEGRIILDRSLSLPEVVAGAELMLDEYVNRGVDHPLEVEVEMSRNAAPLRLSISGQPL